MKDYEKKYKEALERAKKLYGQGTITESLGFVFPELKESEDERIRKAIHIYLDWLDGRKDYAPKGIYSIKDMITWLEKQKSVDEEELKKGALKYVARQFMNWLDASIPEDEMCLSNAECKIIEDAFLKDDWARISHYMCEKLKRQGEQTQLDYEHADIPQKDFAPVKPKFKVGDWIINTNSGLIWKITSILNYIYYIRDVNGNEGYETYDGLRDNYRLWTINDAKEGDVLVDSYSKDSLIILYKGINKEQSILAHCGWKGYNFSIKTNGLGYGGLDNTNYLPATKEQRDLLFQKIAEAGYEWDSEKKELKKMEAASKESEDERIREGLIKAVSRIFEGHKLYDTDVTREEALAWLEKQDGITNLLSDEDENRIAKVVLSNCASSFINYLDTHKYEGKMCVSNEEWEDIENAFQNAMWNKLHRYYCKYIEKQGEQKPDDKVEPKFKVGDWVVDNECGKVNQIASVRSKGYDFANGDYMSYESAHKELRLWDISDAKPGDVLYSIDSKQPFIYKERPQFSQARGYCCINTFGEFAIWNTNKCIICTDKYIPATKEQRNLLFEKMKNAGYEWDVEKKELKKIEPKTLDPDKVIEWIRENVPMFWEVPCSPNRIIDKFKGDFEI